MERIIRIEPLQDPFAEEDLRHIKKHLDDLSRTENGHWSELTFSFVSSPPPAYKFNLILDTGHEYSHNIVWQPHLTFDFPLGAGWLVPVVDAIRPIVRATLAFFQKYPTITLLRFEHMDNGGP